MSALIPHPGGRCDHGNVDTCPLCLAPCPSCHAPHLGEARQLPVDRYYGPVSELLTCGHCGADAHLFAREHETELDRQWWSMRNTIAIGKQIR